LGRLRIAFATNEKKGLEDSISQVFGRAHTYTVLDTEGEKITDIKILDNPAKTYHHGAGPIAVKMLADEGVEVIFANELGIGASELLKQHNIEHISVKPNTKVGEALRDAINKLK
jgi:predicted Fe-Mo cluster-binding NifX family protein